MWWPPAWLQPHYCFMTTMLCRFSIKQTTRNKGFVFFRSAEGPTNQKPTTIINKGQPRARSSAIWGSSRNDVETFFLNRHFSQIPGHLQDFNLKCWRHNLKFLKLTIYGWPLNFLGRACEKGSLKWRDNPLPSLPSNNPKPSEKRRQRKPTL